MFFPDFPLAAFLLGGYLRHQEVTPQVVATRRQARRHRKKPKDCSSYWKGLIYYFNKYNI